MLKKLAAVLALALTPMLAHAQEATPSPSPAASPAVEVQDFSLGDPAAKVQITEYASFTCPHCARFHETVWSDLKKNYIDTGKVHFTYREVYFDRYGLWAAMMARCGGELRYFGIVDILFSTQKEWAGSEDPNVTVENLKKIGRSVGMDDAGLDVCMKDQAQAEALVAHFQKGMTDDGIEGTPTFIVNGTKHSGEMSYEEFAKIVDDELAK
ncbi:DsbA family protein [Paragemmobacter straminiformis]|uniref:DsbA family protein n=1 Tax=Paragemmobacter straminiformis TaxID=2045119 RepID=A0A842I9N6_9RHOB|nr:DsbA family protein [Gemmobacter straminiformis]MBC2836123.1 DsbA family protein [Gemmobacter straminiformis]